MTEEDAHVQEYRDPANVVRINPGQSLGAMLLSGEIDAGIALAGLDPSAVRTVIPNADTAAADWFRQTGAYPVNHVVCIKTELLRQHPSLGAELMRLFNAAKAAAREPSAEARFAPIVGSGPGALWPGGKPTRHRTLPAVCRGTRVGPARIHTGTIVFHRRLTMDIPRLNGVIKALESGKPAFAPFSGAEISSALNIGGAAVRWSCVRNGTRPV